MSSVRQRAACMGLPADFSVVRDFLGCLTQPSELSLGTQVHRMGFRRIDVNLIRVGSDQMTADDLAEIDAAVAKTRDLYAPAQLAVGRVLHFAIPTAMAKGAEHIQDKDEARNLTADWTVPNQAIDVFLVLTYDGDTIGSSPVDGPCNKDASGATGSVIAIDEDSDITGTAVAHEIGHYLGLSHFDPDDDRRLMSRFAPNGGLLTADEAKNMSDHCFTKNPC